MKKKPTNVDRTQGKIPKARTEKDIDDLVHSQEGEIPKDLGEADPDDLVHQPSKKIQGNVDESLADPDDLVHGMGEEDEEPE